MTMSDVDTAPLPLCRPRSACLRRTCMSSIVLRTQNDKIPEVMQFIMGRNRDTEDVLTCAQTLQAALHPCLRHLLNWGEDPVPDAGVHVCHIKAASHQMPHVLQLMKRSKFSLTSAFSCPVRSLSSSRRLASPARSSPRLVSCSTHRPQIP